MTIDRRQFLKLTAASAVAGSFASRQVGASAPDHVAVVGAGIVGASIAYHLSKRGCRVTLIDKARPAAQASGNTFAWINASWFDTPDSYFSLRTHSLHEYRKLAADAGFPVTWGGSLEWYHSAREEAEMAAGVRRIQAMGSPTWMVDESRVAELEPALRTHWDGDTAWCERDGAVDPAQVTESLVRALERAGGETHFPMTVRELAQRENSTIVVTDSGDVAVDRVVIAAGIDANRFGRMVGLSTDLLRPATPGIILVTEPVAPLARAICYTSDCHFLQLSDGRLVVGEKTGAPDSDIHRAALASYPNEYPDPRLAEEHAVRMLATAANYLPALADQPVQKIGVGWRPLPVDGLPFVGPAPGRSDVYFAAMHSGVTLAPIVGRLAAMEILDGVSVDLLRDFRLDRLQR